MTAAEFVAIRQRLGWSVEQTAAECGVTPHVVEAWDRGTLKIPRETAQLLEWNGGIAERRAVLTASGLPTCSTAEALAEEAGEKEGDALLAALDQLGAHERACPTCQERVEYANRHSPPVPDFPVPRWIRIVAAIDASFDRLPPPLRPPPGIAGAGRRMGLWFGVAFSALALCIVMVMLLRAGRDARALQEAGRVLMVVIPAYFIGFYCAGVTYDALRPIGHRLAGYVLRWGLGAAIVYGTIGFSMPLISDESFSVRDTLQVALFLGVAWGLIVGTGLWVKDRLTGKLPKRAT